MKFIKWSIFSFVLCGFLTAQGIATGSEPVEWTWLYRKVFAQQERQNNNDKSAIMFAKEQVSPFSQLIFSWNALRPDVGHFSFFAQARSVRNGQWGSWHKMMEWGAGLQRSCIDTKSTGHTDYIHVRLEGKDGALSDAFRIKIVAEGGALLRDVHGFSVSTSDLNKFKPEQSKQFLSLPSVYIRDVPKKSQFAVDHPKKDSICSPTSCSMLTSYLLNDYVDVIEFASKTYDAGLDTFGSWPFNMAHAFERCSGKARFTAGRLESFEKLHAWLLQKHVPVVVSVRGQLPGAQRPYANGHLLVVVGWDAQTGSVLCHDPAFDDDESTEKQYPLSDFLTAWERSRRLAYLAELV